VISRIPAVLIPRFLVDGVVWEMRGSVVVESDTVKKDFKTDLFISSLLQMNKKHQESGFNG